MELAILLGNAYGVAALVLLGVFLYFLYLACTTDLNLVRWREIFTGVDDYEDPDDEYTSQENQIRILIFMGISSFVLLLLLPFTTLEMAQAYAVFGTVRFWLWMVTLGLTVHNVIRFAGIMNAIETVKTNISYQKLYSAYDKNQEDVEKLKENKKILEKARDGAYPQNAFKFPLINMKKWRYDLFGLNYALWAILIFFIIIL